MFCRNCGKEINENQKYCSFCGKRVHIGQTGLGKSTENGVEPLSLNALGWTLGQKEETGGRWSLSILGKRTVRNALIVFLSAAVVILTAAAVYHVLQDGKEEEKTADETTQETPAQLPGEWRTADVAGVGDIFAEAVGGEAGEGIREFFYKYADDITFTLTSAGNVYIGYEGISAGIDFMEITYEQVDEKKLLMNVTLNTEGVSVAGISLGMNVSGRCTLEYELSEVSLNLTIPGGDSVHFYRT